MRGVCLGGNTPPPERNTAWNKGRKCFHCLGAPNKLIRPCAGTSLIQNDRDFMELIQMFRTLCPRCGSRLAIRISSDLLKIELQSWRVCFTGRRRVTMWWRIRQKDLGARRSSTPTLIVARRPSPQPARPRTRRLFPFARTQAAVSESVELQALAQDPTPTARRGPHAVPTTLDPTIPPTALPRQAGCHMAPPTAISLTACRHQQSPRNFYRLYIATWANK